MTILNSALEYLQLGFSVLPIQPGPSKRPCVPWTEFQKRHPTEDEIYAWWAKWPKANVAIITGAISGIFVVDGDGEIGSRWISENLPRTSVYSKTGRAGGCHCFYRIPHGEKIPNRVNWKPKVDIRGEGGYVIAPPSIHHTGNIYTLIFREGLRGWEELHTFNPYRMPGKGNLNIDLSKVRPAEERFEPTKQGNRNASMASLLGTVFKAGMTPDQAWDYICTWNSKNQPPIEEKSFKVTFRSILKLHQAETPILLTPPAPEIKMEEPAEPEQQNIMAEKTDKYPIECLQPGGLLQEIMTYTEKSSAAHKPIFALAAAVTVLGNLVGQKLMTETGLRTNIYAVSIGYSGCGKNASHSTISALLRSSKARSSLGPTDTASGAAVLRWLTTDNHQVTLLTLDEIGMLLKGLKNPGSPMCELPRILTKIFSETDRPYSKSYADAKLNITVPWHHLSLYASSTPSQFWGNLTEADAASGFLARLLIFEALDSADRHRPVVSSAVPSALVAGVDDLWDITPPIDEKRGDIARVPIPFVISRSFDANAFFIPWSEGYLDLRDKHKEDDAKSAIYGRAAEHAAKLALIHAVSLKGSKLVGKEIGIESIVWATKTVDACIDALLGGIKENISKSLFHSQQQEILTMLRKKGGSSPAREIYRKLHLPQKQFNDILASLLISGEIRQEEKKPETGRPSSWLVLGKSE